MFAWVRFDNVVAIWWVCLSIAAFFNIGLWFLARRRAQASPTASLLVSLSGVYVFVCAFRSVLPRADVQRITLFDTWLSSVFVGRSVATVAELAFAAQWALLLVAFSHVTRSSWARFIGFTIVPAIAVAEIWSWYGAITTHYLGNVIEETIWGSVFALITTALFAIRHRLAGKAKIICGWVSLGLVGYVVFMFTVDVPMYWSRLQADVLANKPTLGLIEGLVDLNTKWRVTYDIEEWRSEIPWMTTYFTLAVWSSIALCFLPTDEQELAKLVSSKS